MNRNVCRTVVIAVISLLFSTIVLGSQLQQSSRLDQQRVQTAINKVRQNLEKRLGHPVPSLSVLVMTSKEAIFVSSVHKGVMPVTKDTYFRVASNTKTFTAAAILKMYQDGWLNYKDKITDDIPGTDIPYVPNTSEWHFPYKNKITIEQLLQHSAGVYDVDNDPVPGCSDKTYTEYILAKNPSHQFTVDEFARQLTLHKLSYFPPGTDHHYSNTGYAILSRIIASVYTVHAKKPKTYADYLHDYLVGSKAKIPLKSIHFPILASNQKLPRPFVRGTVWSKGGVQEISDANMSAQVGEGNGYGTMSDFNQWIRSLMKGKNVLTPETVRLMQTDKSPGKTNYALGCFSKKNLGYGHNGARVGYLSYMAYNPKNDVSVVVLLPLFDLTQGMKTMELCISALYDAAYAAESALGYSGKSRSNYIKEN